MHRLLKPCFTIHSIPLFNLIKQNIFALSYSRHLAVGNMKINERQSVFNYMLNYWEKDGYIEISIVRYRMS